VRTDDIRFEDIPVGCIIAFMKRNPEVTEELMLEDSAVSWMQSVIARENLKIYYCGWVDGKNVEVK
jgi:hypothetical protein